MGLTSDCNRQCSFEHFKLLSHTIISQFSQNPLLYTNLFDRLPEIQAHMRMPIRKKKKDGVNAMLVKWINAACSLKKIDKVYHIEIEDNIPLYSLLKASFQWMPVPVTSSSGKEAHFLFPISLGLWGLLIFKLVSDSELPKKVAYCARQSWSSLAAKFHDLKTGQPS